MRVGFNTTLMTNPGDDLIREGILYFLNRIIQNYKVFFAQKETVGIWNKAEVLRQAKQLQSCGLKIQAGTTIYGPRSSEAECITNFWKPAHDKSILTLAAGSHFDRGWKPWQASPSLREFVRLTSVKSSLLTVRDKLSHDLIKDNCPHAEVHILPCTSLWSSDQLCIKPNPTHAVMNFMPRGGHHGKAGPDWTAKAAQFYQATTAKYGRCVVVAHSQEEARAAAHLGIPERDIAMRTTHPELLKEYSYAIIGLSNRVQGAAAMASMGISNLGVTTDSRIGSLEVMGNCCIDVRDAWGLDYTTDAVVDYLDKGRSGFEERIRQHKARAAEQYMDLITQTLEKNGVLHKRSSQMRKPAAGGKNDGAYARPSSRSGFAGSANKTDNPGIAYTGSPCAPAPGGDIGNHLSDGLVCRASIGPEVVDRPSGRWTQAKLFD